MFIKALKRHPQSLLFIFCLILLFARSYHRILHPEVWAEDGNIFFEQVFQFGWKSIFLAHAGYYDPLQQLILLFCVKLLPIYFVPMAYGFIYILIFAYVLSLLIRPEYAWLIPNQGLRALTATLLALSPGLNEMVGNLCNLNWILFFWIFFISIKNIESRVGLWEGAICFLLASSMGTSILILPTVLLRCFYALKSESRRDLLMGNILLLAALLFSLFTVFLAYEPSFLKAPPDSSLQIISTFYKTTTDLFLFRPWLGDALAIRFLGADFRVISKPVSVLLGLIFIGWIIPRLKERRVQFLCLIAFSSCGWVLLQFIGRPGKMGAFTLPLGTWFLGHRYSFAASFAAIFFWMGILSFAKTSNRSRLATVGLIVFVFINLYSAFPRFNIWAYGKDRRWKHMAPQIEQMMQTGCPASVSGEIYPDQWGMTLKRDMKFQNTCP